MARLGWCNNLKRSNNWKNVNIWSVHQKVNQRNDARASDGSISMHAARRIFTASDTSWRRKRTIKSTERSWCIRSAFVSLLCAECIIIMSNQAGWILACVTNRPNNIKIRHLTSSKNTIYTSTQPLQRAKETDKRRMTKKKLSNFFFVFYLIFGIFDFAPYILFHSSLSVLELNLRIDLRAVNPSTLIAKEKNSLRERMNVVQ